MGETQVSYRNGFTVSFPSFDTERDPLLKAITAVVETSHKRLAERMEKIELQQQVILMNLGRVEALLRQDYPDHTDGYENEPAVDAYQDDDSTTLYDVAGSEQNDVINLSDKSSERFVRITNNGTAHADGDNPKESSTSQTVDMIMLPDSIVSESSTAFSVGASSLSSEPIQRGSRRKGDEVHSSEPLFMPKKKPRIIGTRFSQTKPTAINAMFVDEQKTIICVGGNPEVLLPKWIYIKCIEATHGTDEELGPRFCLRLMQALFSQEYMITHNYSGTNGKQPIDPHTLQAILRQATMQFGSDKFYSEPLPFGKFRDYINNSFRVVAFRTRRGIHANNTFWDANGQPLALTSIKLAGLLPSGSSLKPTPPLTTIVDTNSCDTNSYNVAGGGGQPVFPTNNADEVDQYADNLVTAASVDDDIGVNNLGDVSTAATDVEVEKGGSDGHNSL